MFKSKKIRLTCILSLILVLSLSTTAFASTARGRSGFGGDYKNVLGFNAGTYSYYNSQQCLELANYFSTILGAESFAVRKVQKQFWNKNPWIIGSTWFFTLGSTIPAGNIKKLYTAASKNGAIIYTSVGNIITKIELQP